MTNDERKELFAVMLKQALGLVEKDLVLGMVIVVIPKQGVELPLAAVGGVFSLTELDAAFTAVMSDLESKAGVMPKVADEEWVPPPKKETLH